MESNGSTKPTFETDNASYVLVTLEANKSNQVNDGASEGGKSKIFSNIDDIIAFIDGAGDGESNEVSNEVSNQVRAIINQEVSSHAATVIVLLEDQPLSSTQILLEIGLSKQTKNRQRHIDPLLEKGWIAYTIPDNPTDRNQKYKLTSAGKALLNLLINTYE